MIFMRLVDIIFFSAIGFAVAFVALWLIISLAIAHARNKKYSQKEALDDKTIGDNKPKAEIKEENNVEVAPVVEEQETTEDKVEEKAEDASLENDEETLENNDDTSVNNEEDNQELASDESENTQNEEAPQENEETKEEENIEEEKEDDSKVDEESPNEQPSEEQQNNVEPEEETSSTEEESQNIVTESEENIESKEEIEEIKAEEEVSNEELTIAQEPIEEEIKEEPESAPVETEEQEEIESEENTEPESEESQEVVLAEELEENTEIEAEEASEEVPAEKEEEEIEAEEEEKPKPKKTVSNKKTAVVPVKKGRTYNGKYEVYQTADGYAYQLKASNGEILVISETYASKDGVMKAIDAVKKNLETGNVKIFSDKRGKFKFKLISKNYRTLAISANYNVEKSAVRASESFKKFALKADIVDIELPDNDASIATPIEITAKPDDKQGGKFVYEDFNGEFSWELRASNGQILCQMEGYTSKKGCMNSIDKFKENVAQGSFKCVQDKTGRYQFKLYSQSGRICAVGESYSTKQGAEGAANSVVSFTKSSPIVEEKQKK